MSSSSQPFSYPALPPGPPSRRNWYQELLSHPDCQGDSSKIKEAYQTHRAAYLSTGLEAFKTSSSNPVTADQALIAHLARTQKPKIEFTKDEALSPESLDQQEVNCLGILARPPPTVITLIQRVQAQLSTFVGPDLYLIPPSILHLSIFEFSHRHTISHLRSVAAAVGSTRLQKMLDLPSTHSKPQLMDPKLSLDKLGVALTFVPSADDKFTYHHLRAAMQELALESDVSIDTCYTAASAHVTLGRFVGGEWVSESGKREAFVELVERINEELESAGTEWEWEVGVLELQMGYLKFGVERKRAEILGR